MLALPYMVHPKPSRTLLAHASSRPHGNACARDEHRAWCCRNLLEVRFKGDKAKAAEVYRGLEALTASDIADVIRFCADLPDRVNINRLELMSIAQSFGGFTFQRNS